MEALPVGAASTAFQGGERANRKAHGPFGETTHHLRHDLSSSPTSTAHYLLRMCAVGCKTRLLLVSQEHIFSPCSW